MDLDKLVYIEVSHYNGEYLVSHSSIDFLITREEDGISVALIYRRFEDTENAPYLGKRIEQDFPVDEHLECRTKALIDTLLSYPVPQDDTNPMDTRIEIATTEGLYYVHPNAVTLNALIEYFKAVNSAGFIDIKYLSEIRDYFVEECLEPVVGECVPIENPPEQYREYEFTFEYQSEKRKEWLDISIDFNYGHEGLEGFKVILIKVVKVDDLYYIDEQSVVLPSDERIYQNLLSLVVENGDLDSDHLTDDYCLIKCDKREIKISIDKLPDQLIDSMCDILKIRDDIFDFSLDFDTFLNYRYSAFDFDSIYKLRVS